MCHFSSLLSHLPQFSVAAEEASPPKGNGPGSTRKRPRGKDQDDDKMNGYLYSVYQAVIGGFFGWNVIAVGMIQGSTTIPPEILAAGCSKDNVMANLTGFAVEEST